MFQLSGVEDCGTWEYETVCGRVEHGQQITKPQSQVDMLEQVMGGRVLHQDSRPNQHIGIQDLNGIDDGNPGTDSGHSGAIGI